MKRLALLFIIGHLSMSVAVAQKRITREYQNQSISDALRQLADEQSDYTIYFLYNELEDFRITTSVHRKTVPDAIRQMIGFYPIRVSTTDDDDGRKIFVECIQKADTRYKGTIIDETGQPIAYANVALLNPVDSTLLNGGVSNESGYFAIPAPSNLSPNEAAEPLLLKISFVGYKTVYKRCENPEIGTIRMQPDNIKLKTVKIIGNAIQSTVSGYKVNIKALSYAKDKMLMELLPYLPGINIDKGQITILGNTVTAYYIDGIRNTDPTVLKELTTDRIESIEIDYVAGVDEAKSAVGGIIRITTRREVNGGFSGNVIGNLKFQPDNGICDERIGNTLSASIGNLYVYNNIYFGKGTPKIHEVETYVPKPNDGDGYSIDRQGRYNNKWLGEYIGLSYEINESEQLKGSLKYTYFDRDIDETGLTSKVDGTHHSFRQNPNLSHNIQAVTDYVWKPKAGYQFDFMVDYLFKCQRDRQHSILDDVPSTETMQVQNTHMLRVQPKWQQPLGKSQILTTGLDYQQTNYNNDLQPRTTMSSYAPAAFAKIQGQSKSIQYEVGVRAQYTNMLVKVGDIENKHNDFAFFPTINFMWLMNPKRQHMLNLMYKYSMEDLPYSVISSYRSYSSPYSYETGNPELKAPTGHMLMLMAKLWGNWSLMGGFMRAKNDIYFVSEQSPESPLVTQIKPYNLAYSDGYYFNMEYLLRVGKVWTCKPSVMFRRWTGEVQGEHYSNPFSYMFDLRNDFRFSSTFSGELIFHYEPTSYYIDLTLKPVYSLQLKLKKSFWQERFLLKLETMPFVKNRRAITDNQSVRTTYHNQTKEQYLLFSVTWRFKGGKHLKEQSTAGSIQNYKQFEKKK